MKIKEITDTIERFAPLTLQESYDNAGLIVGRPEDEVEAALVAVDVTDEVLDEAERTGCGLVITHHPLVFHALKRFNSNGCVQRCVERAIRRGIALYACHTNLDSAPGGMSWRLAAMLGVGGCGCCSPRRAPCRARGSAWWANCPRRWIRTHSCAVRWSARGRRSCATARSPPNGCAAWRSARGAGASLAGEACRAGADIYVTSDLKYNDFMTPDGALTIADVGHFESEYCAIDILFDILSEKFTYLCGSQE